MGSLAYRRIWGESAFLLVCIAISNAALFLSATLAVRWFPGLPGESDRYFMAVGVLTLGALLADLGVPLATVKLLSAVPRGGAEEISILASTLRLVIVYACAATLAVGAYFLMASHPWTLREASSLCLCVLLHGPARWIGSVLYGRGMVRRGALYNTLLDTGRLAALGVALWSGKGVGGILEGWAWAGILHLGAGLPLLFPVRRGRGAGPGDRGREGAWRARMRRDALLSASLFLPYAGLFAITQVLTLVLGGAGAPGDASRWAVSLQIASVLLVAGSPIGTVLLPHLSRAVSEGLDRKGVFAAMEPLLLRGAAILGGLALFLFVFADALLGWLFPSLASSALGACRILCALYLVESCKYLLDPPLTAQGHWKALAAIEALRLAMVLACARWAVERWSLAGAVACLGLAVALSAAGKAALLAFPGSVRGPRGNP